MSRRLFPLFCICALLITGCSKSVREQPEKAGIYTHAVIRTHMAYQEEETTKALAPYFQLVQWSDVRLGDMAAHTLIIDTRASRGFFGSAAHMMFIDYQTKQRVGIVSGNKGFLYGGMAGALARLYERIDAEAAYWSGKGPTAP